MNNYLLSRKTQVVEEIGRRGRNRTCDPQLLTHMLRSVRENSGGWFASGEDEADNPSAGLGEEELAKALASAGGLGIASLINQGLKSKE